ncbi:hypothetical protein [Novosphingobium sp. PY1]|uniref:Uncharacterized protein n=1 Tax=Ochrobactrum sp. PW1 TaxID=1882222 RepID=A0A292GMK9_9HYPH|nr:hypothetical protein [Novosphingobium sp. PY1]BBA74384.1 hypothetical protein [Ochrobactrum sp. PW1]GFM29233.1 uncharacterized protein PY1_contig-07-159 [Novosphingobium sp. PY1]
MSEYYIVDVRQEWRHKPYITVWRPDDAGYAYPLSWAGRYSKDRIDANPTYYHKHRWPSQRALERFPVACEIVERMGIAPNPREIDGDAGPVIPNTGANRIALRRARYRPSVREQAA